MYFFAAFLWLVDGYVIPDCITKLLIQNNGILQIKDNLNQLENIVFTDTCITRKPSSLVGLKHYYSVLLYIKKCVSQCTASLRGGWRPRQSPWLAAAGKKI